VGPRHLSMLAITRFAFQDGVRAQPYKYGAPELINLEAYLIARAPRDWPPKPRLRPRLTSSVTVSSFLIRLLASARAVSKCAVRPV
jgi:hypothetical protein